MSLLDEYFPRPKKRERKEPEPRFPGVGIIEGVPWQRGPAPVRKKKRDPHNPTSKQLERIGEGLTRDVFKNQLKIELTKIQTFVNRAGYNQSQDVDFQGAHNGRPLKVEAKAWWIAHKVFPLSRFSDNERAYMRRGLAGGFQCWVTIAILDTEEPSRTNCYALYVIPWAQWLKIEQALAARASGNYKGKSLRRKDLDLIEGCQIVKVKRRWVLPDGHWLAAVLER